jgi:hypothetical protein
VVGFASSLEPIVITTAMPELSPVAQAVWEAFNEQEAGVFVDYGEKLAAALEAAADQVVPEETTPWNSTLTPMVSAVDVRAQFLAIAAELKGDSNV